MIAQSLAIGPTVHEPVEQSEVVVPVHVVATSVMPHGEWSVTLSTHGGGASQCARRAHENVAMIFTARECSRSCVQPPIPATIARQQRNGNLVKVNQHTLKAEGCLPA